MKIFISSEPNKTELAGRLFGEIIRDKAKKTPRPLVVAIVGELGSGKTTFVKGLFKGIGIKGRIFSPTFIIYRRFSVENKVKSFKNIFHIDAYRLKKKEATVDQLSKILAGPQNISIIEWADKIKQIVPSSAFWLIFEHGRSINERIIKIK